MQPIAFVIPWYGENIPGGAESLCRNVVQNLHLRNVNVEILTTCVKEFNSDWNINYYKSGLYTENNIPVKRFDVGKRDATAFDNVNYKLINGIPISLNEEEVFFREMVNSPSLYEYIQDNQEKYLCFVFIPYMFGTTYWGTKQCPGKNVLIPCFHDESYARMKMLKEMVDKVAGVIFNSKPEAELAKQLYKINGKTDIIGTGVEIDSSYSALPERFRKKHFINSDFLLYAGRKDKGKNVDQLIEYFSNYITERNSDLKLVLIGGGNISIPYNCNSSIIDLGFIPTEDKLDAYSASSLFCNPSKNESFSIVIMESWLTETPVIVNGECEVTKDFCINSSGGLYYTNQEEFCECLDILLSDRKLAHQMGMNGRKYVETNYSWNTITNKYINFFRKL